MSKEEWFMQYERLYDMREAGELDATDDELTDMATEKTRDAVAVRTDELIERMRDSYDTPCMFCGGTPCPVVDGDKRPFCSEECGRLWREGK